MLCYVWEGIAVLNGDFIWNKGDFVFGCSLL